MPVATKGAVLFKQRCSVCHTVDAGKKGTLGPNLSHISIRKIGSQSDFNCSAAFRKVPGVW
jgi:cytochrome c